MIKELTVKGRSGVRYIITKSTDHGNAVRIDEAFSVYDSGLRLLVSAKNGSHICLKTVIDTLSAVRAAGKYVHACFLADALFAGGIRDNLRLRGLDDISVVCSDEAAEAARRYSSFVLTVPDSDEGAFFTLTRADAADKGTLIIGCEQEELEKALTALSDSSERNGADK